MYNAFQVLPYDRYDKRISVKGPEDLQLTVDFDDVNHEVIEALVHLMVSELNWAFDRHDDVVAETIKDAYKLGEEL